MDQCTEEAPALPDMKASSVDYQALLTEERLGSYFQAAQGDRMAAFALYEWNIEASAAAVSLSAMVEVVLRNALDRQLAALGEKKGCSDWLAEAPLDERGRKDVGQARVRASRAGRTATHGHLIAGTLFTAAAAMTVRDFPARRRGQRAHPAAT